MRNLLLPIAAVAVMGVPVLAQDTSDVHAEESAAPVEAADQLATEAASEPPADEATPTPPSPLGAAERAAVEHAIERGRLLVSIARAGLLATRDMLSRVSDPEGAGIAGWIAQPEGNAMGVTFYARPDDAAAPVAVYRAQVLGGRIVSRDVFVGDDRPPLTPLQARMAAARDATEALDHQACTAQPFNVLVVPPATADAPVDVYQISAPEEQGQVPLGGHFRSTVAADGTVSGDRGFANGCVDLAVARPAEGEGPRPLGVTHLLDSIPTEIHLLLAQMTGRPLLVAAGEPTRIWLVTGDRIAEVRDSSD